DLSEDPYWQAHLHDLGEVELKHGTKIGLVNLYTGELGNPDPPEKIKKSAQEMGSWTSVKAIVRSYQTRIAQVALVLSFVVSGFAAWKLYSSYDRTRLANGAASGDKSIAVLPFENLSADPENAFFAGGVQDEILGDLAKIADLKVISRTSVMQYKTVANRNLRELAQQLGVAHLVEANVQRVSNRVRVNARLIDPRNDAHLGAQTDDRDLAHVN